MTRARTTRLSAQPWWTAADAAELDALVHEMVRVAFIHRERCDTCRQGGPWCEQLRDAFAAVDEFRRSRILLSRAEWLRAEHDSPSEAGPRHEHRRSYRPRVLRLGWAGLREELP